MKILCPDKSYSNMYGAEPRYNDLQYNDNPDKMICESGALSIKFFPI